MKFSNDFKAEILKILIYKKKNQPSKNECLKKLEYAAGILNLISNNIDEESAQFGYEIINNIQIYLKEVKFIALDKLIIKISQKFFIPKLFDLIKNEYDPEIVAGICYVKYNKMSIVDERIYQVYNKLEGHVKERFLKTFNSFIKPINIMENKDMVISNAEIKIEKIEDLIGDSKAWNCFTHYLNNINSDDRINRILTLFNNNRILKARESIINLEKICNINLRPILYNLLSLTHFLSLEYHEAVSYIDKSINYISEIKSSENYSNIEFNLNCKFLIEKYAEIPTISSKLRIAINITTIKKDLENKMVMKTLYKTGLDKLCLFSNTYYNPLQIEERFTKLTNKFVEFSVLYIYIVSDSLYVYDGRVHKIVQDWSIYRIVFEEIMSENIKILKMKPITPEDNNIWWKRRYELDLKLKSLVQRIAKIFSKLRLSKRIVLVIDEELANFPWESVFDRPAVRILARNLFTDYSTRNIDRVFYLLDPANNLQNTRLLISNYFNSSRIQKCFKKFSGVIGRSLDARDDKVLGNSDLFMYFGHGTGRKHFQIPNPNPEMLFLFGCSSCRLLTVKNFKSNGFILNSIESCKIVIGNLWDVTDKDLDRLTIEFLEKFVEGTPIIDASYNSKKVCKLKYLNSAALVIYGII